MEGLCPRCLKMGRLVSPECEACRAADRVMDAAVGDGERVLMAELARLRAREAEARGIIESLLSTRAKKGDHPNAARNGCKCRWCRAARWLKEGRE